MHARLLAAVISAACFLSACGFVPPAPPMPPDSGRVAINQVDPRSVLPGKSPTLVASAPIPPIPVPRHHPLLKTRRPASPPWPPAAASFPPPVRHLPPRQMLRRRQANWPRRPRALKWAAQQRQWRPQRS